MSTLSSPLRARWMAIWLPLLATDRLHRACATQSDRPLAVYAKTGNSFALTAVDANARQVGLHDGMSLSDARAICPALDTREADSNADLNMLDQIAAWCERFTPLVVRDAPDGLFLDITGCAHLYDGEEALLAFAQAQLKAQGFCSRAAIAPTPGAAWALAHHRGQAITYPNDLLNALAPLPIAALRLEPETAALLKRLGLKRIGQILDAPRAAFTARAGQNAMLRLDQALGRAREALNPRRPPPPLYALRKLAEPVITLEALLHIANDLCVDLCTKLDEKGVGARRFLFSAFGLDGRVRRIGLNLSRLERSANALMRLFREKLEREAESFSAEFGFEAARLDALEIDRFAFHPAELAPSDALYDAQAEARLVDTLVSRLGAERVGKISMRDVHAPERSSVWNQDGGAKITPPQDGVMRRPLCLFARAQPIDAIATVPDGPPIKFRWRRVLRTVIRAEGPERIAPNWLRASDENTRDYYRVEDESGQRYWLYRERFYGGAQSPRWFLHGLFA